MLTQQLRTVNIRLHHVGRALSAELLTARAAPSANPVGFLLWHMARSQDWGVNTAVRGVAEVVHRDPWPAMPGINIPGIGTGFRPDEAAAVAASVEPGSLLAYADAVHEEAVGWLRTVSEADLDAIPDVAAHDAGYPEYQRREFLEEMNGGPERDDAVADTGGQPVWLFLTSVCVTHLHRHLGEVDLTLGVLTGRAG